MPSFTAAPANWTNSSDANFRAWGNYIAGRFAAVGLVQTTDTGQINWTTVLAPLAINTYTGYEIWRFADALQASAPIFFKIEYGSTSTAAANPGIRVTFGTSSDGAGNLGGVLSFAFVSGVVAYVTPGSLFGSGGTNRFVFVTYNAAIEGMRFGFERTVDASGNPTSEGIWWFSRPSASTTQNQIGFYNRSTGMVGPATGVSNDFAALFPNPTGVTGLQTIVAPVFMEKGIFGNPSLNILGYLTGDIPPLSTPSIFMYGAAHTYFCVPAANGVAATLWRGAASGGVEAMAIRYE